MSIDPEAWENMVEGFGEGSFAWDPADYGRVDAGVIGPIQAALDKENA